LDTNILRASTKLELQSARDLSIKKLAQCEIEPTLKISLAQELNVDAWVAPACELLARRPATLTMEEAKGNLVVGGKLFRRYLLNGCQEEFERGWASEDVARANTAAEISLNKVIARLNKSMSQKDGRIELSSEEYYAAQKAKRQGLGLVKFIGELFNVRMVTELSI
jgi:hypothetical protein